jgi:L-threonylcarbamoyladenylate synthase
MKTVVMPATDPDALMRAQQILREGGLVAFPTDTVYGLGAGVLNQNAVARLYVVKDRAEEKAIPVLAASVEDVGLVAKPLPAMAKRLAERFWPGPLTLVVWRLPDLSPQVSPYETVAVRVPDHDIALALLKAAGPLAVTSANRADGPSSLSAGEVMSALGGTFDLLLDGGSSPGGLPSTIVDCTQDAPRILRSGPIPGEVIKAALA